MKKSGFTLVEIIIAVIIFIVIGAGIMSTFLVGRRSWSVGSTQVAVQQAARLAIDLISKELVFSSPKQTDISLTGDAISFRIPDNVNADGTIVWSELIQYSLSSGQIIRTIDTETKVVANDIQSLQFTPLGLRRIDITVGAQKTTTEGRDIQYTLSAQVYLRNEQ